MAELTNERKAALVAQLQLVQDASRRAEEDLKIFVARAVEAGMTLREIRDVLGVGSPYTVGRWRDEGEQARARRRSEDPGRPGEPDPVG